MMYSKGRRSRRDLTSGTNYSLILYSVGFHFNTTYEEAVDLTGASVYPIYHVQAQDADEYLAAPSYVRMSSTDPNARRLGNYVQYDNISPASDGSLTIVLTPESTNTAITYLPPLNALQLIKVVPGTVTATPSLGTSYNAASGSVTVSWTTEAAGFVLQSSSSLAAGSVWTPVTGAPNPISAAGSVNVNVIAGPTQFYRLKK